MSLVVRSVEDGKVRQTHWFIFRFVEHEKLVSVFAIHVGNIDIYITRRCMSAHTTPEASLSHVVLFCHTPQPIPHP